MTSAKWQRDDPSQTRETLLHLGASAPQIMEVIRCIPHQLLKYYELAVDTHIVRCLEAHKLFYSESATAQREPAM